MAERLVLGIDTATVVCAGLAADGELVASGVVTARMAHAEQLTPLISNLFAEAGRSAADLTDVVVGLGPGPYTGLRVGIVTARVFAEIAGARLRGVCTLDVIAAEFMAGRTVAAELPGDQFIVASDARRREVYWARYAPDGTRLEGPAVGRPADVPRLPTVGPATLVYPELLEVAAGPTALNPGVLALTGLALPDAGGSPLYLRRPDAAEPGRRKSVLVRRGPR